MPVKHDIDVKAKLLITTCEGVATDIEFIEALKKYQKKIQSDSAHSGFNEVIDLTKVTNIKITLNGIKSISHLALKTDNKNVRSKLAFIVNSKFAFSLVRLYKTYRSLDKKSNKAINIFNDEKDAFEWVNQ